MRDACSSRVVCEFPHQTVNAPQRYQITIDKIYIVVDGIICWPVLNLFECVCELYNSNRFEWSERAREHLLIWVDDKQWHIS